jgi:sialic acid synthase
MGKKLVAARDLQAGHVLAEEDVAIKSPADGGLKPYELEKLVGRTLRRPLGGDETIMLEDFEPAAERAETQTARLP